MEATTMKNINSFAVFQNKNGHFYKINQIGTFRFRLTAEVIKVPFLVGGRGNQNLYKCLKADRSPLKCEFSQN